MADFATGTAKGFSRAFTGTIEDEFFTKPKQKERIAQNLKIRSVQKFLDENDVFDETGKPLSQIDKINFGAGLITDDLKGFENVTSKKRVPKLGIGEKAFMSEAGKLKAQKMFGVKETPEEKRLAGERGKIRAKQTETARVAEESFNRVRGLFEGLVSQKKASLEETGGGGFVKGKLGAGAAGLRVPGFESTAAFEGQRKETAAALVRIITGQNRFIRSLFTAIETTLPTVEDTESFANEKIAQSIKNAFRLRKAMLENNITESTLQGLSGQELEDTVSNIPPSVLNKQEEKEADKIIANILGTPAVKKFGAKKKEKTASELSDEELLKALGR